MPNSFFWGVKLRRDGKLVMKTICRSHPSRKSQWPSSPWITIQIIVIQLIKFQAYHIKFTRFCIFFFFHSFPFWTLLYSFCLWLMLSIFTSYGDNISGHWQISFIPPKYWVGQIVWFLSRGQKPFHCNMFQILRGLFLTQSPHNPFPQNITEITLTTLLVYSLVNDLLHLPNHRNISDSGAKDTTIKLWFHETCSYHLSINCSILGHQSATCTYSCINKNFQNFYYLFLPWVQIYSLFVSRESLGAIVKLLPY